MTLLVAVRSVVVVMLLLPLVWLLLRPGQAKAVFARYFLETSGPLNLGLLRIWIFFLLASRMAQVDLVELASLPEALRLPPVGWRWLARVLPLYDENVSVPARTIGVVSALLASLGLQTRLTAPVAALSATYILGLPNLFGKVNHDGHAAVWFAFLLAASASGDAVSMDALLRTRKGGRPRASLPSRQAVEYALPLRLGWLLLGLAYFFPGFYKAWESGDLWINGEKIIAQTASGVVSDKDFSPIVALYESPLLASAAGIGTLIFEMGFIYLLFSKKWRWVAPLMGVFFHVGVKETMRISFMRMLSVYVSFIDFEWLILKLNPSPLLREHLGLPGAVQGRGDGSGAVTWSPWLRWTTVVGGALIAGNLVTGVTATSTWPVSAFPLFASRSPDQRGRVSVRYDLFLEHEGKQTQLKGDRFPAPLRGGRYNKLLRRAARAKGKEQQVLMTSILDLLPAAGIEARKGDILYLYKIKKSMSRSGERKLEKRKLIAQVTR